MATTSAANHGNAGHIRKRPYQPSITSYFNARDASIASSPRLAGATSPLSPPLPAETQISLLSVGMRVRKSVAEGYKTHKTHKTLGSVGFPFPSTAPPLAGAASTRQGTSTRELMPFCGLHNTGGWAAQVVPSSAPAVMQREEVYLAGELEVPGLTMSQSTPSSTQESFGSSGSAPSGNRKRTYEDETEVEIDAYFDELEADEAVEQQMVRDDRPIASMKGKSDKGRPTGAVRVVGEDDFEDAAFLAPMEVDEA